MRFYDLKVETRSFHWKITSLVAKIILLKMKSRTRSCDMNCFVYDMTSKEYMSFKGHIRHCMSLGLKLDHKNKLFEGKDVQSSELNHDHL